MVDTAGDTETDSVLKGVVRAERLENPEDFVDAILQKVKHEHLAAQYGLPKDGDDTWKDSVSLMEMIAKKSGRLLKGGEPCLRSAAIALINDFQRGRLPHYVAPPELKEDDETAPVEPTASVQGINAVKQNLDEVGQEKMGDGQDTAIEEEKELEKQPQTEQETPDADDSDEESTGAVIAGGDWDE